MIPLAFAVPVIAMIAVERIFTQSSPDDDSNKPNEFKIPSPPNPVIRTRTQHERRVAVLHHLRRSYRKPYV